MSADQFHQVVLLPQGEFARFLRSDAGERAKLLQRLFATDRFRRVEDWLAERRRQCANELEAGIGAVLRLAARVAQAAGVDEPLAADDGLPPAEWAGSLLEAAEETAEGADAAAATANRQLALAEQALREAEDLRRRQQRRAELLDREAALVQGRPLVAELSRRLDAGRRAARVQSELDHLRRRGAAAEALTRDVQRARSAIAGLGLADASAEALRADVERRRRALGQLDVAQHVEEDLRSARDRERTAGAAAAEAVRRAESLRADRSALPGRVSALRQEAEVAEAARNRLPEIEVDRQRLLRAGRLEADLTTALASRRTTADRLLLARERSAELREEAARLRVERFDFMIAELAAGLVDGDPCAVCGSPDHPDPSEVRGSRVSKEQEDAARRAADSAQQAVAEAGAELAALDAEISGLRQGLDELGASTATGAGLRVAIAEVTRTAEQTRQLAERLEPLRLALDEAVAVERALAEDVRAAEQVADNERERCEEAAGHAAELGERLRAMLGDAPDVATARRTASTALQRIEGLLDLEIRAEAARGEWDTAVDAARDAAEAAGFSDLDEARGASLPPETMQGIEQQIDEAKSAEAAVAAGLADPELAVETDPPAPVGSCAAELAVARREAGDRATAAARGRTRTTELRGLVPGFERQRQGLEPLRTRAAEVRHLADLAAGAGANRLRMTLSAYVLAARLEEVAAVASERLRRMTQGRYTLVHTDAGRGNGRSGLGLLARDAWTGQDRDTATLSGGETFLASLALALALGDVVTAEAGGAAVDALFIDEGFGSLDEETLEEVMDTLDSLREGGRLVGLVSHVGELRLRIPAQINVRKGRNGSTVSVNPG
jgi:exonuclease SbcC